MRRSLRQTLGLGGSKEGNKTTPKKLHENLCQLIAASDNDSFEQVLSKISPKELQRASRSSKFSCLHTACEKGNSHIVSLLIQKNADINQLSKILVDETSGIYSPHQSPLHIACKRGHLEIVKLLLDQPGINPNIPDYHHRTPLVISKKLRHAEISVNLQIHEQLKRKDPTLILKDLDLRSDSFIFTQADYCFQSYVTRLDISHNLLLTVPPVLCTLVNLTELSLSENAIFEIPTEITQLRKLEKLHVRNNRIDVPPFVLGRLELLTTLSMENNPLKYFPPTIQGNNQAILQYLKAGIPETQTADQLKLILVGPAQSGKSYLLKNITKEAHVTRRVGLGAKDVNDAVFDIQGQCLQVTEFSLSNDIHISAWDCGMKDIRYRTHLFYLTGRTIYFLVLKAFDVQENVIESWLQQIKVASQFGKSEIVLIASQIDDPRFTEEKLEKAQKCFEYCSQQSGIAGCLFISNKTKENLPALKQVLLTISEKHKLHNISIPGSWILLGNTLNVLYDRRKIEFLSYDQLIMIAEQCDIKQEKLADTLNYLRDIGTISFHIVPPATEPVFIVLNASWLTKILYRTKIYAMENQISNGIIEKSSFGATWNVESKEVLDGVLQVLLALEIAYAMRAEPPQYLFPCLLDDLASRDIVKLWSRNVDDNLQQYGRVYQFGLPSDEVFPRLIVRFLHIMNIKCISNWINGILLQLDRELAVVTYNHKQQTLVIKTRVPKHQPASFLRVLVNTVDSMIESIYQGSELIQTFIPCLHCLRFNTFEKAYLFQKKECIKAWASGSPFVYCHQIISNSRCVRVDMLAPDLSFGEISLITDIEIGKQIGEGGFGKVYKGIWEEKVVAIKELNCKDEEAFASMFEEFSREVYTMSSLDDPNLVRLYGITVSPLRMVMEFVSGGDLYHILHSDRDLSLKLRLRIALDIANGMKYLQNISPPIMHRDLRSPNILIETLDENAPVLAKVADFGLALSVAPQASGFLGTWQWHAPEVLDSNSMFYDEAADIYSFAIVLWEIFTSGYPFEEYRNNELYSNKVGTTEEGEVIRHFRLQNIKQAIIHDHLRPGFTDPENVEVPVECQEIISACWHPDKAERPRFGVITARIVELIEKFFPGEYVDKTEKESVPEEVSCLEKPLLLSFESILSLNDFDSPVTTRREDGSNHIIKLTEKSLCMVFAANKVWIGGDKGTLMIYNARDRTLLKEHPNLGSRINDIVAIARQIWCACANGALHIYDTKKMTLVKSIANAHKLYPIRSLASIYQENISSVWSCAPSQNRIFVWNSENFEKTYNFKLPIPVACFYIYFNYLWVGSGCDVYVYKIDYRFNTLRSAAILRGHTENINAFEHPNEDEIWSCSDDGIIIVWSLSKRKLVTQMDVNSGTIKSLHKINNFVWASSINNAITWWTIDTKEATHELDTSATVTCITKVGPNAWVGTANNQISVVPTNK